MSLELKVLCLLKGSKMLSFDSDSKIVSNSKIMSVSVSFYNNTWCNNNFCSHDTCMFQTMHVHGVDVFVRSNLDGASRNNCCPLLYI